MNALLFVRDNARFLAAGMILMFASSFGQTFFISTFAGEIMQRFSLSDGQWGGIYTIGTCASAVAMFWAGALTDRFRVRLLAWVVLPGLAVSCFLMAFNPLVPGLILCVLPASLLRSGDDVSTGRGRHGALVRGAAGAGPFGLKHGDHDRDGGASGSLRRAARVDRLAGDLGLFGDPDAFHSSPCFCFFSAANGHRNRTPRKPRRQAWAGAIGPAVR